LTTPAAAPAIGAPLAYLGEAVAAAAVVQTAGRLGVLARLDGAPATTAELTDACEISERGPACLVTAVDLPAVVPATRRAVRSAGRERQFRFRAGDLDDVDLGRGVYDLAIAGNLCHPQARRRLMQSGARLRG